MPVDVMQKKMSVKNICLQFKKLATSYQSILKYLSVIIVFWLCFALGESEWPHKISYAFHEAFYVPVSIGIYLIPVVAVVVIYKYIAKALNRVNIRKNMMCFLFVSLVFFIHMCALRYTLSIVTTAGYAVIEDKMSEEGSDYIYVRNKGTYIRLKCPEQVYNQLVVDDKVLYKIEYRWSKLRPDNGKIILIDTGNMIDNRKFDKDTDNKDNDN